MQLIRSAIPKAFPALQSQASAQLQLHLLQIWTEIVPTQAGQLVNYHQLQILIVLAQ